LGLVDTLSRTFGSMDPAYSNSSHEISEVAALLMGKGEGGLWHSSGGPKSADETEVEFLRGGAVKFVELSGLTKAVAACLESSHKFIDESDAKRGTDLVSSDINMQVKGVSGIPDSDDEDDEKRPLGAEKGFPQLPSPSLSVARTVFLRELWLPLLLKPILKRWTDSCEPVRIGAIRLTASILSSLNDLTSTLPFLVPALLDRANGGVGWVFDGEQKIFAKGSETLAAHKLGRVLPGFTSSTQGILVAHEKDHLVTRVAEPSEEGRAAVCSVVHSLLTSVGHGHCLDFDVYALDVILSIHALSVDAAPSVRVLAVPLIVQAVNAVPHIMKHFAVAFIRSLMGGGLDHRHAKVRLATLDAIDTLVHCPDEAKQRGAGSEAILYLLGGREANVVPVAAFYGRDSSFNYAAKLALEGNPAVRLRWVGALGGWCTRLPDRFDWWSFLVPYLLSEVAGGGGEGAQLCPSAEAAMSFLDGLGAALEVEKAGEIMDKLQYDADERNSSEWKWNESSLPNPFNHTVKNRRPRLGTRMFVRAQARRVLTPLLGELRVWSPFAVVDGSGMGTRARAASYLACLLLYFEEGATGEIGAITSACTSCIDLAEKPGEGGTTVTSSIRACVRLLGRYVPLSHISSFLSRLLDEDCGGSLARDQEKGIPSSVLFVASLVLGEAVKGGDITDASLGSLISLIDSVYKKTVLSHTTLNKALLQWSVAPGNLAIYHRCSLESNSIAMFESKIKDDTAVALAHGSIAKKLPASITQALSQVRKITTLEGGSSGASTGRTPLLPSEHLSATRARYLSCVIFTSRLLSLRPEMLSNAIFIFLPQLLSLRGELQAEGGEDPASTALVPCPHWGVFGHPTPPETFLSRALSSRCPKEYQQTLSSLLTSLTTGNTSIYSPCPFSGLLGKAGRPIPLGLLTDMALLALAHACGIGIEELPSTETLSIRQNASFSHPFPSPMPIPPSVLQMIARKFNTGEAFSRVPPSLPLSVSLSAVYLQLAGEKGLDNNVLLSRAWSPSFSPSEGLLGSFTKFHVLLPLLSSLSKKSSLDISLQLVQAGIDFALSSEDIIGSRSCAVWAAKRARTFDVCASLSAPLLLSRFVFLWLHWCTLRIIEDEVADGPLEDDQNEDMDFSLPTLKQEIEGAMMGLISLNTMGCCTILEDTPGVKKYGLYSRLSEHAEVLLRLQLTQHNKKAIL
jgi:hypothetical protein